MIDKLIARAERLEKKTPGSKTDVIAKLKMQHNHSHHHHGHGHHSKTHSGEEHKHEGRLDSHGTEHDKHQEQIIDSSRGQQQLRVHDSHS
jgi:hypothetical protein